MTRPVHAGPLESSERRNDVFGTAVAIDGDRLAVGAPGVDDDGFNAGLIYVFEREGGEWRRDAAVRPDEPIGLSYFGASVALRGDVLVVGAPFDWEESVHDRRGAGYVFVRSSGAWEQQLVVRTGDDADDLRERVALGRERAAFTATARRLGADLVPGVVIVVGRDGEAWREEARIERPDVEGFGLALAMDDDRLVVTGDEPDQLLMRLSVPPNVEPRRVSVDAIEHFMIYREHPHVGAIVHIHAWWRDPIPSTQVNYPCGTYELAYEVAELVR